MPNHASARQIRHSFRDAFTIVELLVVISIIALLIAMLLPSLSQARQTAVALQCMVNERSVGLTLAQYCSDNKGWTPDYSRTIDNTNATTKAQGWVQGSKTFGSVLYALNFGGFTNKLIFYGYIGSGLDYSLPVQMKDVTTAALTCPFDKNAPTINGYYWRPLSYIPNCFGVSDINSAYDGASGGSMGVFTSAGFGSAVDGGTYPNGYGVMSNTEKYNKPSSYFAMLETNVDPSRGTSYFQVSTSNRSSGFFNYVDHVFYRPITATEGSGQFNHNGASNILFADNHAVMMKKDRICLPTTPYSAPTIPVDYGPGNASRTDNWGLNKSAILLRPLLP